MFNVGDYNISSISIGHDAINLVSQINITRCVSIEPRGTQ